MTTFSLSELINNEVTDFINEKVAAELGIKPDTQVNANDVIPKMELLPFVDLGQMDDVRFMIDSYDDDEIKEYYPEIAKALRDPNKKGYVADAMWNVFSGADNAYELDDAVDAGSNFGEFLADVNDYLKDLD